jgi:hypothetical protein
MPTHTRLGATVGTVWLVLLTSALDQTASAQSRRHQSSDGFRDSTKGDPFVRSQVGGGPHATAMIGGWNVTVSQGTGDMTLAAEAVQISAAKAQVGNETLEIGGDLRIDFGQDGQLVVKFGANADAALAGRPIRLLLDGNEIARFAAPANYKDWVINKELGPDLFYLTYSGLAKASIKLDDKEVTFFEVQLIETQAALLQLRREAMRQREPVKAPEMKGVCPPGEAGRACREQYR